MSQIIWRRTAFKEKITVRQDEDAFEVTKIELLAAFVLPKSNTNAIFDV